MSMTWLLVMTAGIASVDDQAIDVAMARAIQTAYQANRAQFRHGTVRFRHRVGLAANSAAALAGTWEQIYGTSDGRYVFDGVHAYYESIHPLEEMARERQSLGSGRWTTPLGSSRYLTNGKETLRDELDPDEKGEQLLHTARIDSGLPPSPGMPLGIGLARGDSPPLGEWIGLALDGDKDWILNKVEPANIDEIECVLLAFRSPGALHEFWIDVERGAVPIRYVVTNHESGLSTHKFYDDLRAVDNGGWLPFRRVSTTPGESLMVHEVVLTEADFANKPDPDQFRMEFPEPTPLIHQGTMVRYDPQKVWDLRRLPSVNSAAATKIVLSEPGPIAPTMPGALPRSRWWIAPAAVLGVAVLIGGFVWLRRARG